MFFGISICLLLGLMATWLGSLQHVIGAPLIGMFLGILVTNIAGPNFFARIKEGAAFSSKVILRVGIILCGGTLSFATIVGTSAGALPYIILSIGLAFLTACLVGKYLISVTPNTRILVAGGTSICGGTAIATLSAKEDANSQSDTPCNAQKILKAFPVFILGFLILVLLNMWIDFFSIALVGTTLVALLKVAYKFCITAALVGVGCKISLKSLFTKGIKPILLGGCTWGAIAIVTFCYVAVFM